MSLSLPPYISREEIHRRLPLIIPEGLDHRSYMIREMAASTIFTCLYIGAVEGAGRHLSPSHVYRMTEELALIEDKAVRDEYFEKATRSKSTIGGTRWYADNTREPIRDETIKNGFYAIRAILVDGKVATTASKGRYYLQDAFAALFDPFLDGDALDKAIRAWQDEYLSTDALMRIRLAGLGSDQKAGAVLVTYPNQTTRLLSAGPSTGISKAVIEDFAVRFLKNPGVIWLSTSDEKVGELDNKLAKACRLNIQADKSLPDIILVDLGVKPIMLVFVEVVATDGAMTRSRKEDIYAMTDAAGLQRDQVALVSAYLDKSTAGYGKTIRNLAWNTFAWFMSEPANIVHFKEGEAVLADMLRG